MTTCIVPGCKTQKSGAKVSLHLFPDPCREPERHLKWVRALCAEKVLTKDPTHVFKQLRVCRSHFDEKSFNGICKKLLGSAIPTLNLGPTRINHCKTKLLLYETKLKNILRKNSTDIQEESFQLVSDAVERCEVPALSLEHEELSHHDKMWLSGIDIIDESVEETYELMEVESPQGHGEQFRLVMKKEQDRLKTSNYSTKEPKRNLAASETSLAPLNPRNLHKLRNDFNKSEKIQLARKICSLHDPLDILIKESNSCETVYQHTVDLQRKVLTEEPKIERRWDLAALTLMRIPFVDKWNLDEFEFSQAYFFYWDKIERSYYFLNNIVETAKRGEEVNGRLVSFLLSDPIGDGGQWDMIVSIINKHGVMPKKCFPESFSCESSSRMNAILKSKLREYAKQLRDLLSSGAADNELQSKVDTQMHEIYNIVGICLGIPPATFTWEFYDKNKKYNSVGPISPLEFYEKHVKPVFNVDDKVCLVTDPRPSNEFGKGYTVDCLGNVVGGRAVFYNNQPVDVLIDLVAKSIKAGEAVWFGCDLKGRKSSSGFGLLDTTDFNILFDTPVELGLSKPDRLKVGESHASHALLFSGVDGSKSPTKFRVENVHELTKENQFLHMSRSWFSEFVVQVAIDKRFVSDELMQVLNEEPETLPAWDAMGSLML